MNKNKVIISESDEPLVLNIRVVIEVEGRTFYVSTIKPYNPDANVIIEEIDKNKNIIGILRFPQKKLLGLSQILLKEFEIAINYKSE